MNKVQIMTVSFCQICLRSEGISSTCTVTTNSDLMENLGYICWSSELDGTLACGCCQQDSAQYLGGHVSIKNSGTKPN